MDVRSGAPPHLTLDQLVAIGWDWLRSDAFRNQPGWSGVWRKLMSLRAEPDGAHVPLDQLLLVGWDWARKEGRCVAPGWNDVLQALVGARSDLPDEVPMDQLLLLVGRSGPGSSG
jgi:hypothetical protein